MPVALDTNYVHVNPAYVSAYQICHRAEKEIIDNIAKSSRATDKAIFEKDLVYIRVLGHLFSVGLPDTAKTHVTKSIFSCTENKALIELGMFYEHHFIRPCKGFFFVSHTTIS